MIGNRKQYEISFLVKDENGAATLVGHLTRFGAEIAGEGNIARVELAYPVRKYTSAYAGTLSCTVDAETISGIRDALNLDKDILRFLIVTPPVSREHPPQASVKSAGQGNPPRPKVSPKPQPETALSNDLLEEKLEEILK